MNFRGAQQVELSRLRATQGGFSKQPQTLLPVHRVAIEQNSLRNPNGNSITENIEIQKYSECMNFPMPTPADIYSGTVFKFSKLAEKPNPMHPNAEYNSVSRLYLQHLQTSKSSLGSLLAHGLLIWNAAPSFFTTEQGCDSYAARLTNCSSMPSYTTSQEASAFVSDPQSRRNVPAENVTTALSFRKVATSGMGGGKSPRRHYADVLQGIQDPSRAYASTEVAESVTQPVMGPLNRYLGRKRTGAEDASGPQAIGVHIRPVPQRSVDASCLLHQPKSRRIGGLSTQTGDSEVASSQWRAGNRSAELLFGTGQAQARECSPMQAATRISVANLVVDFDPPANRTTQPVDWDSSSLRT
jgi:hypothetical protein